MKNTTSLFITLGLFAAVSLPAADSPTPASATAGGAVSATKPATPQVIKIKPYPLDSCIVSGDKIGSMGTALTIIQDGQEVKFCCSDCPADFAKDPAKYLKLIAEAAKKLPAATAPEKEAPVKPYPLDTCLVMNKKLGSMGVPIDIQYRGQEIKLCCKDCRPSFDKDPLGILRRIPDTQTKAPAK